MADTLPVYWALPSYTLETSRGTSTQNYSQHSSRLPDSLALGPRGATCRVKPELGEVHAGRGMPLGMGYKFLGKMEEHIEGWGSSEDIST